jgi:hypothetical protein
MSQSAAVHLTQDESLKPFHDMPSPPRYALKVVGNEKVGGSEMCQSVPIWLGPRRSRFVCLLILLSSLILCISVSAPVKQNE